MKPSEGQNFCRVFELPEVLSNDYCFNGGVAVFFKMVDWFNPWPTSLETDNQPETWEEVVKILRPWLMKKSYVKPGRRYILITEFGESMQFTGEPK